MPGNWIIETEPFLTGVPPSASVQKRVWACTSFTIRCTWPSLTPRSFAGSPSCANPIPADSRIAASTFITSSLVPLLSLLVGGRSRSAAEQFAAIGQFNGAAIGDRPAGLRAKARDFDLGAGFHGIRFPPESDERVRCAEFETPVGRRAVGILHVDVYPCMRIRELHLRDDSIHLDRFVHVELGGERVMRACETGAAE